MSILVVDDEPESRRLLTAILTAEGYEVRAADGGELALASLAIRRPNLILLDIRMPGMDGLEVCRRLKERADTRDIPLMFLSASAAPAEQLGGCDRGRWITLASRFSGRGIAYLPATEQSEPSPTPRDAHRSQYRGSGTILLVEDDESVRKLTAHMLKHSGTWC